MRETKARRKKKNVKNMVCIILIVILLAMLILTLYIEKRDVAREVFAPIQAWAEIVPTINVDDAIYLEETESEEVKI